MQFDSTGGFLGIKLSNEDTANFEVLRDVVIVTVFGFLHMGCTLTPPGKYD